METGKPWYMGKKLNWNLRTHVVRAETEFSCMNVSRLGYIEHKCLCVSKYRDGQSQPVPQGCFTHVGSSMVSGQITFQQTLSGGSQMGPTWPKMHSWHHYKYGYFKKDKDACELGPLWKNLLIILSSLGEKASATSQITVQVS